MNKYAFIKGYMSKEAFLPGLVGAGIGTMYSPEGRKVKGAIAGAGTEIGTEAGTLTGAKIGALLGGGLAHKMGLMQATNDEKK